MTQLKGFAKIGNLANLVFLFSLAQIAVAQRAPREQNPRSPSGSGAFDIRHLRPFVPSSSQERVKLGRQTAARQLSPGATATFSPQGRIASILGQGTPLTSADSSAGADIARRFLAAADPDWASVSRHFDAESSETRNGPLHVSLRQVFHGVPVLEARADFTLTSRGEIISATFGPIVIEEPPQVSAQISAARAAAIASRSLNGPEAEPRQLASNGGKIHEFENPVDPNLAPVSLDLVYFPLDERTARFAWRIYFQTADGFFELELDAEDGALLYRQDIRHRAGRARVWRRDPTRGARDIVEFPDSWLSTSSRVTTGNNADAYLDTNGDDRPDGTSTPSLSSGRAFSATQNFDFPSLEPAGPLDPREFPAASVTNLFYHVNRAHDFFYGLGFDEASWNFQTDNFGKGGQGGDAVLAESQDRFSMDSASMVTFPEGRSPRLETGIETRGTMTRLDDGDGALDGDTAVHEYGHGVTTRIVGRGTDTSCLFGMQSGAMAEGWSDYFAMTFYNSSVFGSYIANNAQRGIRRYNFAMHPLNYGDLGNGEFGYQVHDDGEIWAAVLWDLRTALDASKTDRLIVAALRSTPCRASMVSGRDAILAADQALNQGANRKAIWEVFAKRGIGFSACGRDGSLLTGMIHHAAFDLPADLAPGAPRPPQASCAESAPPIASYGTAYRYQIPISLPAGQTATYELLAGPPGMRVDSTGLLTWMPTFAGRRFVVAVVANGVRVVHGGFIAVITTLQPGAKLTIAGSKDDYGILIATIPAGVTIMQVTLRGGSGDADLDLFDPDFIPAGSSWYLRTSNETLGVARPKAGIWTIGVAGYTAFSGVTIGLNLQEPVYLPSTGKLENLSEDFSGELYYRIQVPKGARSLRVTSSGGSGDADIYLRFGDPVVCRSTTCRPWDYASFLVGNIESILVPNPREGDWFLTVNAYGQFRGLTVDTFLDIEPTLVVSESAISFSALERGTNPPGRIVTVSEGGGRDFNWSVKSETGAGTPAWLSATPATGSRQGSVTVSANLAGLAPGVYKGKVIITASPLLLSPREIEVTLTVLARPRPAASPASLSFQGRPGIDPQPATIALTNAGGLTLNWTAAADSAATWLIVDPSRGTGPATIRVTPRSASLAPGRYSATITVVAIDGLAPLTIPVTLEQVQPVTIAGYVHAVTGAADPPLAPGTRLLLQGTNFHPPCGTSGLPACPSAAGTPKPRELGGTFVTFNGLRGELWSVAPGMIDVAAPVDLTGNSVDIVVRTTNSQSAPLNLPLVAQSLAIFPAFPGARGGAGMIRQIDPEAGMAVVARAMPMMPGVVYDVLFTGGGALDAERKLVTPVRVTVDGEEVEMFGAGIHETEGGIYRAIFRAPAMLARAFPTLLIDSPVSASNPVSAGGTTIVSVTPASVRAGADTQLRILGGNFAPGSKVRLGEADLDADPFDAEAREIVVNVPAALLGAPGRLEVRVFDPAAPAEDPSNAVPITVSAP